MKVLVTGATGFVGNYVVDELLRNGHIIVATSANKQKAEQASWFKKVNYKVFDFADFNPSDNYYVFFDRPDLMIHLAWEGLPNYDSSFHEEINLPRHLLFLSNLIENGLRDLTVTGTCLEYGMQEGCLTEDMPSLPVNSYGKAKDRLRKELELLQKEYPIIFKWIRLFYMYGKGQSRNSLLSQLNSTLEKGERVFNMSGGEQARDFLPVEEVAAHIVKIALQARITGIINCCSGQPVTVRQFVEKYLQSINKTIRLNLGYYPYPDYEPMQFWGDNAKLKSILRND